MAFASVLLFNPIGLSGAQPPWFWGISIENAVVILALLGGTCANVCLGSWPLRYTTSAALLIDLHSMPPLGPKRGADAAPDFVIGDRFGASCDATLSAAAFDHFGQAGRRVAHNRPYAGGYVLDRHAAPGRGLHGLQVEICRSAYLDAKLHEPGPGLAAVARVLSGLVRRLAEELAVGRALPQAAE